jgi:hypothetical protein
VHLGLGRNAFRVVAPFAFETAAFKKNRGPETRTVFGGHPLNFQDGRFKILVAVPAHHRYFIEAESNIF